MVQLIIARHGNTFGPEDTPTRVGARTDLPLVESGRAQAIAIGQWLDANKIKPDIIYTSQLQRTIETAKIALNQAQIDCSVYQHSMFNEIDYGPDENQPEEAVIKRIGAQALQDWDQKAIVPPGWKFDLLACINQWHDFAKQMLMGGYQTVLVVTSNGTARFAPHITGDFDGFSNAHAIKLSTGALGILDYADGQWVVQGWNIRPDIKALD